MKWTALIVSVAAATILAGCAEERTPTHALPVIEGALPLAVYDCGDLQGENATKALNAAHDVFVSRHYRRLTGVRNRLQTVDPNTLNRADVGRLQWQATKAITDARNETEALGCRFLGLNYASGYVPKGG